MKIFKNKYDKWETTAHFTTQSGSQIKNYIEVGFKKGFEPTGNEIEGELIYRTEDGTVVPKLIVMHPSLFGDGKKAEPKNVQTSLTGNRDTVDGHIDNNITIDTQELPFY